jgi:hypothetical protein
MRATISSIFFLVVFFSQAQKTSIIDTIFYRYADSKVSFFEEHQKFIKDLGLKDLTTADNYFTIRITEAGSLFELDVDSNGSKTYKYVNYSWKYNKKKFRGGELLLKFNTLSEDSVEAIYQKLKSTKTDSFLLTDRRTWDEKWEGNSNIIEISTKDTFKLIMFNQTVEDRAAFMKPAKQFSSINDFLVFVRQKIRYQGNLWRFQKSLPVGKYSNGHVTFWNYDN